MELLYYYAIFALSGALTTMVTIWYPAYKILQLMEPNNMVVVHKKLYFITIFMFAIVLAPALLIAILHTKQFIKAFVESLLEGKTTNENK
jgi:hypothetical protein